MAWFSENRELNTERKFVRRPWIHNVLLSENLENPVPKKAKARVTWLNGQKNRDGTHSGEITDYVYKINVVFSKEAVVECLEDRAHGHIFKHFTDILGGAVVLTDYKVVPRFSEREFVILIKHFKVMPGFIGPLAYIEEIPNNVRKSKHEEEVKEKLQSLWVTRQHADLENCIADSLPCIAITAEDGSLEQDKIIDALSQGAVSEINSQEESGSDLSFFVEMADEVLKEQEEREDLIELCHNYEPLGNTDDLEVQDLLDRLHIAHTKYAPFSPQSSSEVSEINQTIQMPTSDDCCVPTANSRSQSHREMVSSKTHAAGPQSASLDMNLTNFTKADLTELCRNYQPIENTEDLEISVLLELLHQAHIKYAPFSDSESCSQSTNGDTEPHQDMPALNVTHPQTLSQSRYVNVVDMSDVARSQTPSSTQSSKAISPRRFLDDIAEIMNFAMSNHSQSSLENQSLYLGDASRFGATTGVTNAIGVGHFNGANVSSQTLIDETNCEDLPSSSRQVIDRILNVTVSQDPRTPVARPSMQLSQTPARSQKRQKRKEELWKFVGGYWKDKKNKKLRKK